MLSPCLELFKMHRNYCGLLSGQFMDKSGQIHYYNIWLRINKQALTPAEQTFR